MEIILKVIGFIQNLGSSVMMAVVVTLLGILFGTKPGKALRAGLTVGVGLVGITTIFGLLGENLGPATQAMVERYGFPCRSSTWAGPPPPPSPWPPMLAP